MKAHMNLSNFESAIEDYKALLDINPENTVVKQLMQLATSKQQDQRQREKSICFMMFNKVQTVCKFCTLSGWSQKQARRIIAKRLKICH